MGENFERVGALEEDLPGDVGQGMSALKQWDLTALSGKTLEGTEVKQCHFKRGHLRPNQRPPGQLLARAGVTISGWLHCHFF